jgi:hypothetical protein
MSWWIWVLGTWAVVGGGIAFWFGQAMSEAGRLDRSSRADTPRDDGSPDDPPRRATPADAG